MEFKESANVITADGKGAGSLQRVVIKPESYEVTHIVVQSGLLFKDDKVIPVTNIASAFEDEVALNCTDNELQELPPLKIEVQVPNDASGRGQAYDPVTGGMLYAPPSITETRRTIPEELVALKEGAPVISDDNKHIGNLECVVTRPASANVTHLMISHGFLTKSMKLIPIQWVKMLDEEKVQLTVEAREFALVPPNPD
jgi:uncharacterized protein YrrD